MSKFFFVLIFCLSHGAFAASILQAKNNRILISMDGDKIEVGQMLVLKNADGKEVAKAVVTQAKGEKAIAVIKSGKADGSESISVAGATAPEGEEGTSESFTKKPRSSSSAYRLNVKKVALLLTISMNSMETKQADRSAIPQVETVALAGTGFGLAASVDWPLSTWLIFRGTLGYEPFTASGSGNFNSCADGTSRDCTANISYLSAGGFARFNFTKSKYQFWGGLGGTGKFPAGKSSTALKTDDIKLTVTFAGAGGLDWYIASNVFVPVSLEYQLFQSSDTVTANQILIRGGYGWTF